MKTIGIRTDRQQTRYALVESNGVDSKLLNDVTESRLRFPADISLMGDKVYWLYRELQRILHEHPDIERVGVKTNEYTPIDNRAKRESAYLEGVVLLFFRQADIAVNVSLYVSLETRSSDVKNDAHARLGRTTKYWDAKMADAVIAAWHAARI